MKGSNYVCSSVSSYGLPSFSYLYMIKLATQKIRNSATGSLVSSCVSSSVTVQFHAIFVVLTVVMYQVIGCLNLHLACFLKQSYHNLTVKVKVSQILNVIFQYCHLTTGKYCTNHSPPTSYSVCDAQCRIKEHTGSIRLQEGNGRGEIQVYGSCVLPTRISIWLLHVTYMNFNMAPVCYLYEFQYGSCMLPI